MVYELIMDKINLTNSCPSEVKKVYDFISSNQLYEYIDEVDVFKALDKSFFSSISEEEAYNYYKFFDNFVFKYDHFTFEEDYTKGYFRSSFLRIKDNILAYLENKFDFKTEKLYQDFDSNLPASPPSEAYRKVGNNNLNIKPSGRDYGLLFR